MAAGPGGYARIRAVFPEEWDLVEVAAMSLGFEDVTTAIDLCANAVYLASGGSPSAGGRFKDGGQVDDAGGQFGKPQGLPSCRRAPFCRRALERQVVDLVEGFNNPNHA